jgi:N-acetylglucosaminyldiphosphoundecaprenol N-acetyl-beta-D-mannosaminyltransferase
MRAEPSPLPAALLPHSSEARLHQIPSVVVGGLPIAIINRGDSARLLIELALARRGKHMQPLVITSANGHVLSLCARDGAARSLFLAADLIHVDGMPLVFASRLKCGTPLPERVATTDLFHDVAVQAQSQRVSFYLLGATEATVRAAVANVRRWYPMLEIAGFRNGYFEREKESRIVAEIDAAKPDILWIARGVPEEQRFAITHRARLRNVGVVKTAGGLFDFLSGRNRRAPAFMQAAGLEWLFRAAMEPRRLLMRYLITSPHAVYLLLSRTEREGRTVPHGGPQT